MLSPEVEDVIQNSFHEAHERGHDLATIEHLVYSLLHDEDIEHLVLTCGIDLELLRAELGVYLDTALEARSDLKNLKIEASLGFQRVIERASIQAKSSGRGEVWPSHVLVSVFEEKESPALFLLNKAGLNRLELVSSIGDEAELDEDRDLHEKDPLSTYAVDLTEKATKQELDILVGREEELTRVIHI